MEEWRNEDRRWCAEEEGQVEERWKWGSRQKCKNMFLFPGSIYFHFWPVRSHLVLDKPSCVVSYTTSFLFLRFPNAMCSPSSSFLRLSLFPFLFLRPPSCHPSFSTFPFSSLPSPVPLFYFFIFLPMSWLFPSFFLSSFVDFPLRFGVSSSSLASSFLSQYPSSFPAFLVPSFFRFFLRFPSSCALYFSLTHWGQLHKRQPVGSNTKHRPYRPLPDNGSNFSRHYILGCLALEDRNGLLSRVVLGSYKHKVPIFPKEWKS